MNFDFAKVLSRSWQITWKYKVLWIFGMLASCGRGGGGSGGGGNNSGMNYSQDPYSSQDPFNNPMVAQYADFIDSSVRWLTENMWVIWALVGLFLLIWILQIVLSILGSIGLIRGAYQAETGAEKIAFLDLLRESTGYFWRMLGLIFLLTLPIILIVFTMVFLAVFSMGATAGTSGDGAMVGGMMILTIFACCCFMFPLLILFGIYTSQATRALVIEDLGVLPSLARGWDVFRSHFWELLIMAVFLFIINLMIGIVIAIPIYIAIFPLSMSLMQGNITSWQPIIIVGVLILLYSPIAWLLSGISLAYSETAWTLTYLDLRKPPESNAPIPVEANA